MAYESYSWQRHELLKESRALINLPDELYRGNMADIKRLGMVLEDMNLLEDMNRRCMILEDRDQLALKRDNKRDNKLDDFYCSARHVKPYTNGRKVARRSGSERERSRRDDEKNVRDEMAGNDDNGDAGAGNGGGSGGRDDDGDDNEDDDKPITVSTKVTTTSTERSTGSSAGDFELEEDWQDMVASHPVNINAVPAGTASKSSHSAHKTHRQRKALPSTAPRAVKSHRTHEMKYPTAHKTHRQRKALPSTAPRAVKSHRTREMRYPRMLTSAPSRASPTTLGSSHQVHARNIRTRNLIFDRRSEAEILLRRIERGFNSRGLGGYLEGLLGFH